LSSQPAQVDPSAFQRAHESSSLRLLALPAALTLAIAACDLVTLDINFAILYILPLVLVSRTHRPRVLWQWALALVLLTFAGYVAGVRGGQIKAWHDLLNFRLVNRSMVAFALISSAGLLHIQIGLRELMNRRSRLVPASAVDEHVFDDIVASFDRFATSVLCVVLMAMVTLTDVLTPPQFNIPILFCLPLVAAARIRQRWIVWAIVPLLFLLAVVGLYLGPRQVPVGVTNALMINRLIASLVLIGVAIILHGWIGSRSR